MREIKFIFNHPPYLAGMSFGEQKGGWGEGWRNGMPLFSILYQHIMMLLVVFILAILDFLQGSAK